MKSGTAHAKRSPKRIGIDALRRHKCSHGTPACGIDTRDYSGVSNGLLSSKMRLDCVEFDPVPAKLYLSVYASEEFDCSVRPLAHAIASAVETCTGPRREWVLNKLLRCEFWLVYIAQRYARAAGVELSFLTDRRPAACRHRARRRSCPEWPIRSELVSRAVCRAGSCSSR